MTVAYKGLKAAAAAVGVSEDTLRRAIANTNPETYPAPLVPDGRHGRGGQYAFTDETLRAWVKSLSKFDT